MIRLNCELIFCLNSKYRLYNHTDITMNDYETLRQIIGSTFYNYEDEEKVWNSGWVYRDLDWDNLHYVSRSLVNNLVHYHFVKY